MGRSISSTGGGGGGLSVDKYGHAGPRNQTAMFNSQGSWTWNIPSTFNSAVPIRVWVYGAGGCNGNSGGSGQGYGGGGGGLAWAEIPADSTITAGGSVSITVGAGSRSYNGLGGTSSFGSYMSASGGNSGARNDDNQGLTGYGRGGYGIDGTITAQKFRGGRGGSGSVNPGSGYGGGGGAAPHPDHYKDGYQGGNSFSHTSGSGASINFPGTRAYTSYCTAGGAGTAGYGMSTGTNPSTYYGHSGAGGAGLDGSGGRGASVNSYSNQGLSQAAAGDGKGSAIWGANHIFLGGGGGGGGSVTRQSSEICGSNGGCGGPGAGGGGVHSYQSTASCAYHCAGAGGVLGGGGGAAHYNFPGPGGSAGGGGGSGYGSYPDNNVNHGWGGDGLVFIQYAIIV